MAISKKEAWLIHSNDLYGLYVVPNMQRKLFICNNKYKRAALRSTSARVMCKLFNKTEQDILKLMDQGMKSMRCS